MEARQADRVQQVGDGALKGRKKALRARCDGSCFIGREKEGSRKEALFTMSAMMGAVTMARVVTDPDLSVSILRQARKHPTQSSSARTPLPTAIGAVRAVLS